MSRIAEASIKGNIALLLGGDSSERAVSLVSGDAVYSAMKNIGLQVEKIDSPFRGLENQLQEKAIKHAFIILHGGAGENGQVQALLDGMGITYTGSGVMGCAIAMDKQRTKLLWKGAGIPTADFMMVDDRTPWQEIVGRLGDKVILKPVSEGSSIGMAIADSEKTYAEAISLATQYDDQVMAEKWISGSEYTVAILDDKALPIIKLETDNRFYDYQAKYQSNDTRYICPCGLNEKKEKQIQSVALEAFRILGCKGWGRVDVMMDETEDFYLLEANTVPGMTDHSLVPMAAKAAGIDFEQLVERIFLMSVQ